MADYLSDHPMMNKETPHDMATGYAVQVDVEALNSDHHHRYYRRALKEQVHTLQSIPSLLKQRA